MLLDLQRTLRLHRTAAGDDALDKLSRLAARAVARRATDALHAGSADGVDGDARELLVATGLLGDDGAVAPPADAERLLGDWLKDRLGAAVVRDLDACERPGGG